MAITIKSIRNCKISVNMAEDRTIDHIGFHTVSISFETDDKRYHVWLSPPYKNQHHWTLGQTLFANKIEQPRYHRGTAKLDPAKHEKAIDHVLRMSGAGEGTFINGPAIDRLIADHNARATALNTERIAAANAKRVAAIRAALADLDDLTTPVATVLANASDAELIALDSFLNTL